MAKDIICGMYVDENKAKFKIERGGVIYYFCSKSCLDTFLKPEIELKRTKYLTIFGFTLGSFVVFFEYIYKADLIIPHLLLLFLLATPVQFIAGFRFYRGLLDAIKSKQANMDSLIAIGTSAAWSYSTIVTFQSLNLLPQILPYYGVYFVESSLIISFILLGTLMEHMVKHKAYEALRKLYEIQPNKARVIRNGIEVELPVEEINVGDIIIVKPGERIPVDGIVIEGFSSVDQSPITGESIPVEKTIGDTVISGSINKNGYLKIRATKVGEETTASQIIKIVEEAILSKVPLQRLADKISSYFVPVVILIAVSSFIIWYFVFNLPFGIAFVTLISVLIIACPCALGIATPMAIMIGAGKGAKKGILIKSGEYLEKLSKVNVVVFDKTGTLTKGELKVTDIIPFKNYNSLDVLKLASLAEKPSEHPIAKAILKIANEKGIKVEEPEYFENLPGFGVYTKYKGNEILVGKKDLMVKNNINIDGVINVVEKLQQEGKVTLIVSFNKEPIGVISLFDTIREEAYEAIESLKKNGIKTVMLTGDNYRSASYVAKTLGIEDIRSDVLPHEKYKVIEELKKEGKVVAMVGDGINDAPALAASDVGIAIGSGTDIAKETGGIILITNNLKLVPKAIELSKLIVKKIKQNLFWAFFYNVTLIPIAAGILYPNFEILLNPIFAAMAMASSSITVVLNSMLLNRYE
jgi:Cu+-exporting ATPase